MQSIYIRSSWLVTVTGQRSAPYIFLLDERCPDGAPLSFAECRLSCHHNLKLLPFRWLKCLWNRHCLAKFRFWFHYLDLAVKGHIERLIQLICTLVQVFHACSLQIWLLEGHARLAVNFPVLANCLKVLKVTFDSRHVLSCGSVNEAWSTSWWLRFLLYALSWLSTVFSWRTRPLRASIISLRSLIKSCFARNAVRWLGTFRLFTNQWDLLVRSSCC